MGKGYCIPLMEVHVRIRPLPASQKSQEAYNGSLIYEHLVHTCFLSLKLILSSQRGVELYLMIVAEQMVKHIDS